MSISSHKSLIEFLADGSYHSGEALGEALGISRAAIWKRLQSLSQYGVVVESVKGLGYRVPGGLSLLDSEKIHMLLSGSQSKYLNTLTCFDEVASTNEFLLREGGIKGDVCIAERQSAGRGRRGRNWFSPFGKNLYMSICWQFEQGVAALDGLSLAVGVLLSESLGELGVCDLQLKWPNDLLVSVDGGGCRAKLGGILIEVGGDLTGDCKVVIGVGLNVSMSDVIPVEDRKWITQPWSDLKLAGYGGDRNRLVASLLSKLLPALNDYPEHGFSIYKNRWERLGAFMNESVSLHLPGRTESGVLQGVNDSGALILQTKGVAQVFNGGEVSLRAVESDY